MQIQSIDIENKWLSVWISQFEACQLVHWRPRQMFICLFVDDTNRPSCRSGEDPVVVIETCAQQGRPERL